MSAPAAATSRLARTALAVGAALPALLGIHLAVGMARAAWLGPGWQPDPVVVRVGGSAGERGLERAARLAPLDFRYPFRLGEARWFRGRDREREPADVLRAHAAFLAAARRAPTDARARFYLSGAAAFLGRAAEADLQCATALGMAPLNSDLRARVARYFAGRYEVTGSLEHFALALRGSEGARGSLARGLLAREDLGYEESVRALSAHGADPAWTARVLAGAGRHDWALRFAAEADPARRAALEGDVRVERARALLQAGDAAGAVAEIERAEEALGGGFAADGLAFRARLAAGDPGGARAGLARALDGGRPVEGVAEVLAAAGLAPREAAEFWEERMRRGDRRPDVRYQAARAALAAGEPARGQELLQELREVPAFAARANGLLARSLCDAGAPAMARRYAAEALRLEPENEDYRRLWERVRE